MNFILNPMKQEKKKKGLDFKFWNEGFRHYSTLDCMPQRVNHEEGTLDFAELSSLFPNVRYRNILN